jgi:L-lysine exporter family protein LysE/ArgO
MTSSLLLLSMPLPVTAGLTGSALGLTLIAAIGAQNAFVLRQGLRREHVGAIVLLCALADALLIAAGIAGLAGLIGERHGLTRWLALGGAAFLTAYGLRALWRALRPAALLAVANQSPLSRAQAITQALAFTLLNPHVYLDTVVLVGVVGAQHGEQRWWFGAGAAAASFVWFSALGYGARWLAPLFARPVAWRVLDVLIGATMLALASVLVLQYVAHQV